MAKISARGDSAKIRWTRGPKTQLVLTEQGRLLQKGQYDTTYKLIGKRTEAEAHVYAERRGWEKIS